MEKDVITFPARWSLFQFWKNTFFYYCLRGWLTFFTLIPKDIAVFFGWVIGFFGYYSLRRYRKRALKHLKEAFGTEYTSDEIKEIVKNMFRHLGRASGEALHVRQIIDNLSEYVEFEGDSKEKYLSAMASKKGVIFCSAHLGNWELFSSIMAHIGGPINIVARRTFDPRVTRLITRFRSEGGVVPLWRHGRPLVGAIADVLKQGGTMGFLIDQDLKVPGIFVPFFGKPAYTASAPAHFALDLDAIIILGIMRRKGKRYSINIQTIDVPRDIPRDEAVYRIIANITEEYEKAIRDTPEQWIWMHRRWRTKPEK